MLKVKNNKTKEVNKLKREWESAQTEIGVFQAELEATKNELAMKKFEIENLKAENEPFEDIDSKMEADEEEYCDLLSNWLNSHEGTIIISALAVFHGVKAKAKLLWTKISRRITLKDFVSKWGPRKGWIYVEGSSSSDSAISLISSLPASKGNEYDLDLLDVRDFAFAFDPSSASTAISDPTPLFNLSEASEQEVNFIGRVTSWLEENNGYAMWNEFIETFPSTPTKEPKELLKMVKESHHEVFFGIPANHSESKGTALVLKSQSEKVFLNLFLKYLKSNGGVILASKFAHFVETFPGALQLKERLPAADSKVSALAKKFPQKLHFWRDGECAMCCLSEERARIEEEKAEQKRKEAEAKAEVERTRIEREKIEAEKKATQEWESRRQRLEPESTKPTTSKTSRWGSQVAAPPTSMLPTPVTATANGPPPPLPQVPAPYPNPSYPPQHQGYTHYPDPNQPVYYPPLQAAQPIMYNYPANSQHQPRYYPNTAAPPPDYYNHNNNRQGHSDYYRRS
jgi:type II secretory pathway pseudopilin PulG